MVLHLASLWNRGSGQLGNGLWRQRRFTWVWRLGFQSSCSVLTCRWRELVVTNKWIHWSKGGTTWHFTCVILITNGRPTIHTFSVWWENWKAEIIHDVKFFCVEESVKATLWMGVSTVNNFTNCSLMKHIKPGMISWPQNFTDTTSDIMTVNTSDILKLMQGASWKALTRRPWKGSSAKQICFQCQLDETECSYCAKD